MIHWVIYFSVLPCCLLIS